MCPSWKAPIVGTRPSREPPARTSEVAFRNSWRVVISSTFRSRGLPGRCGQRRARSLRQAYGRARSSLPARGHEPAGEIDPGVVTATARPGPAPGGDARSWSGPRERPGL